MIYLIDEEKHSSNLLDVIKSITSVDVILELVDFQHSKKQLIELVKDLLLIVRQNDIVLCPWLTKRDNLIDFWFSILAEKCFVICAAGNSKSDISLFSPTNIKNIITVGALNKNNNPANFNNFSNSKDLVWEHGTNIPTKNGVISGTSVAAAIYAAKLSLMLYK